MGLILRSLRFTMFLSFTLVLFILLENDLDLKNAYLSKIETKIEPDLSRSYIIKLSTCVACGMDVMPMAYIYGKIIYIKLIIGTFVCR